MRILTLILLLMSGILSSCSNLEFVPYQQSEDKDQAYYAK